MPDSSIMSIPVTTTESVRQLVQLLKAKEQWDKVMLDVKSSIRGKVDNAASPEEAFQVTLELKAADRFFAFIITQAEGN